MATPARIIGYGFRRADEEPAYPPPPKDFPRLTPRPGKSVADEIAELVRSPEFAAIGDPSEQTEAFRRAVFSYSPEVAFADPATQALVLGKLRKLVFPSTLETVASYPAGFAKMLPVVGAVTRTVAGDQLTPGERAYLRQVADFSVDSKTRSALEKKARDEGRDPATAVSDRAEQLAMQDPGLGLSVRLGVELGLLAPSVAVGGAAGVLTRQAFAGRTALLMQSIVRAEGESVATNAAMNAAKHLIGYGRAARVAENYVAGVTFGLGEAALAGDIDPLKTLVVNPIGMAALAEALFGAGRIFRRMGLRKVDPVTFDAFLKEHGATVRDAQRLASGFAKVHGSSDLEAVSAHVFKLLDKPTLLPHEIDSLIRVFEHDPDLLATPIGIHFARIARELTPEGGRFAMRKGQKTLEVVLEDVRTRREQPAITVDPSKAADTIKDIVEVVAEGKLRIVRGAGNESLWNDLNTALKAPPPGTPAGPAAPAAPGVPPIVVDPNLPTGGAPPIPGAPPPPPPAPVAPRAAAPTGPKARKAKAEAKRGVAEATTVSAKPTEKELAAVEAAEVSGSSTVEDALRAMVDKLDLDEARQRLLTTLRQKPARPTGAVVREIPELPAPVQVPIKPQLVAAARAVGAPGVDPKPRPDVFEQIEVLAREAPEPAAIPPVPVRGGMPEPPEVPATAYSGGSAPLPSKTVSDMFATMVESKRSQARFSLQEGLSLDDAMEKYNSWDAIAQTSGFERSGAPDAPRPTVYDALSLIRHAKKTGYLKEIEDWIRQELTVPKAKPALPAEKAKAKKLPREQERVSAAAARTMEATAIERGEMLIKPVEERTPAEQKVADLVEPNRPTEVPDLGGPLEKTLMETPSTLAGAPPEGIRATAQRLGIGKKRQEPIRLSAADENSVNAMQPAFVPGSRGLTRLWRFTSPEGYRIQKPDYTLRAKIDQAGMVSVYRLDTGGLVDRMPYDDFRLLVTNGVLESDPITRNLGIGLNKEKDLDILGGEAEVANRALSAAMKSGNQKRVAAQQEKIQKILTLAEDYLAPQDGATPASTSAKYLRKLAAKVAARAKELPGSEVGRGEPLLGIDRIVTFAVGQMKGAKPYADTHPLQVLARLAGAEAEVSPRGHVQLRFKEGPLEWTVGVGDEATAALAVRKHIDATMEQARYATRYQAVLDAFAGNADQIVARLGQFPLSNILPNPFMTDLSDPTIRLSRYMFGDAVAPVSHPASRMIGRVPLVRDLLSTGHKLREMGPYGTRFAFRLQHETELLRKLQGKYFVEYKNLIDRLNDVEKNEGLFEYVVHRRILPGVREDVVREVGNNLQEMGMRLLRTGKEMGLDTAEEFALGTYFPKVYDVATLRGWRAADKDIRILVSEYVDRGAFKETAQIRQFAEGSISHKLLSDQAKKELEDFMTHRGFGTSRDRVIRSMVKEYQKDNPLFTAAEAAEILDRHLATAVDRISGHMERSRIPGWEGVVKNVEDAYGVYFHRNIRRVAEVAAYGPEDFLIHHDISQIRNHVGDNAARYAQDVFDLHVGRERSDLTGFWKHLYTWQGAKLSLGVFANATQPLNTIMRFGIRDFLAGMNLTIREAKANPLKYRENLIETGILINDIASHWRSDGIGALFLARQPRGVVEAGIEGFVKILTSPFNLTETINRGFAAGTGRAFFRRQVELLRKDPLHAKASARLRELEFDPVKINELIRKGDGGALKEAEGLAAMRAVTETQFQPGVLTRPLFASQTTVGKFIWQFKTFVGQQVEFMERELDWKKHRDNGRFFRAFAGVAAYSYAGEEVAQLRKAFLGKTTMTQALETYFADPSAMANLKGRTYAMLYSGSFGFLGDLAAVMIQDDQLTLFSFMNPPAMGTFRSAVVAGNAAIDAAGGDPDAPKKFWKAMAREAGGVGLAAWRGRYGEE